MTQITLDASLSSKLNDLTQPVDLCDPSGRILGRFVPLIDMSEWEPLSPDISEEELERRTRSHEKRYTTAEVLAHLSSAPDQAHYEAVEPQISSEELERRRQEPDYSTAEVLAHLQDL